MILFNKLHSLLKFMLKEKLNIGLIGVGRWGKNILRTIQKIDNVNLSCIATRNKNSNYSLTKECIIYPNWKDLISHTDLDGIIIATPPHTHFEIAKNCLHRKINILVEKPLTFNSSEALFLKKLSYKMNTLVMTEFTQVFNPKFQKMQESLDLVGQIQSIKTQASNFGPIRNDTPVIWDWGSHELSILISLVGSKPENIKIKRTMNIKNEKGDISSWEIKCKFKGGIKTTSSVSNNMPKVREIFLQGNKGIMILDEFKKPYLEHFKIIKDQENLDKKANLIYLENNNEPLLEAIKTFLNCIQSKQSKHWSLELGIDVTYLLEKAYEEFSEANPFKDNFFKI